MGYRIPRLSLETLRSLCRGLGPGDAVRREGSDCRVGRGLPVPKPPILSVGPVGCSQPHLQPMAHLAIPPPDSMGTFWGRVGSAWLPLA